VFGNGVVFVVLQLATATILTIAANTAYNGFPSLSSIVAKDGYLPASWPAGVTGSSSRTGSSCWPRQRLPCSSPSAG